MAKPICDSEREQELATGRENKGMIVPVWKRPSSEVGIALLR